MALAAYRAAHSSPGEVLAPSESESNRFGLKVARAEIAEDSEVGAQQIRSSVEGSDFDVVIVRYSAQQVDWFADLRSPRYTPIHADTIVYFEKALAAQPEPSMLRAEVARSPEEVGLLGSLARGSFHEYKSHYFANPLFKREAIADGYAEWALSFCASDRPRHDAFLARTAPDGHVAGFAAVSYDPVPEFALVAVAPTMSGRGFYGHILDAVEVHLSKGGSESCVISTQVHNLAVIRTVTKRSYRPILSLQTVHLVKNDLLGD